MINNSEETRSSDENRVSRGAWKVPSPRIRIDPETLDWKNLASQIMTNAGLGRQFWEQFTADYNDIRKQIGSYFDPDVVLYGWSPIVRAAEPSCILNFLAETGIPLAGATPPSLGVELLDAETGDREVMLLASKASVLEQCKAALEAQETGEHAALFDLANRALIGFEAGHVEAAQALATVALDRTVTDQLDEVVAESQMEVVGNPDMSLEEYEDMVRVVLGRTHRHVKKSVWLKDRTERLEELDVRRFLTMPILTSAYAGFSAKDKDAVLPKNYSRHATVHSGDPEHFSEANALRALMTVVSLLWSWHPTKALETRSGGDNKFA